MHSIGHRFSGDMTNGNITLQLIAFAIPIILGNIFQQLYNTADAIIVSKILGNDAFASVSVAMPIMSVAMFFLVGLTMGVGVLLSQKYGARRYDDFKVQNSTAVIAGVVFTISISIICIALSRVMLKAANTPTQIFEDTNIYLKIVFGGLIFSFLYNYFASALRSVGNSTAAFVFLVVSVLINIVLDFVFVKFTPFGVAGAAIATIISQAIAAILCIIYVYKNVEILSLKKGEFIFKKSILKTTIAFSWAAALQQTFLYLGRMLIQGTINAQGTIMITGYNAAVRIEAFDLAIIDGTQAAIATFAGQNIGAGTVERIKKGLFRTIQINIIFSIISAIVFWNFPRFFVSLYIEESAAAAIDLGAEYIKTMAFAYVLSAVMSAMQGFFRGLGKIKITMIATMSQIVIRVVFSVILIPIYGIKGVCISVILGWALMVVYGIYQYNKNIKHEILPANY